MSLTTQINAIIMSLFTLFGEGVGRPQIPSVDATGSHSPLWTKFQNG